MIKSAALRLSGGVTTISAACMLAGCAAPNVGSTAATAISGGTSSTTTSSTSVYPSAFGPTLASNARAAAAPNSALVVYVPRNTAEPIVTSPASGYAASFTEFVENGSNKAILDVKANLPGSVSMDTANMQPALRGSGSTSAVRVYGEGFHVTDRPLYVFAYKGIGGSELLTDATYGFFAVTEQPSQPEAWGAFHVGTPTPQAQMPTNVTATYSGAFTGVEIWGPSRATSGFSAPMTMTANFTNGTVAGVVPQTGAISSGFNFNGTITGNAYQGTAAFTATNAVTTSSALNGAFYGTNASQTAGAVMVQGTPIPSDPATGQVTIVGGFGGKR